MERNSDFTRQTRLPGATDNTRYGEGRAFPHSFLISIRLAVCVF